MRNLSRSKDGVSRFQTPPPRADLHEIVALNHVEPLVFVVVQMARGTAFLLVAMFHHEESALAVLCRHLEGGCTGGNWANSCKPVLTRRDEGPADWCFDLG